MYMVPQRAVAAYLACKTLHVQWRQQHVTFGHVCHVMAIHLYEIAGRSTGHVCLCDLIAPCRALCSLRPGSKQCRAAGVIQKILPTITQI